MKRLLPLLFLVPSLALILYAKRDRATPSPSGTVRVHVDTGGFSFPADVQLTVSAGGDVLARVEDGVAELTLPEDSPVLLQLEGQGPVTAGEADRPVPIGQAQRYDRGEPTWTLVVTPDECRAAMAAIRR